MKYWRTNLWNETGGDSVLSEQQILDYYWDYWSKKMYSIGKPEKVITKENCIDDWAVIHWAWEDNIRWREMKDNFE